MPPERASHRPGFVYIMTNREMPGLVKIGHTGRAPVVRAAELSAATGVPGRFVVAWQHPVRDHEALEGIVHDRLGRCRANDNREFFRCTVPYARQVIQQEAAALLLPWWRAWLFRQTHPLAYPKPPRSAQGLRRPKRSYGPESLMAAALVIVVTGVLILHPGWIPTGLMHLLERLPGLQSSRPAWSF